MAPMSTSQTTVAPARVVLLLGIGTAISLLGDSTLYTVLPRPEIAAEAGVTLAMVGILLGANRAIRLLTNGLAGVLYDRFPRRPLLIASLFVGALSTLIFAIGRGPAPLLISRLLWGAAWSGIWVGGNAVLLDVAPAASRGKLSGQYQTWFFVGVGGAALIGGVLTDLIGFRGGLLVGGIVTALAAGLWLVVLPHTEGGRRPGEIGRPEAAPADGPAKGRIRVAMPRRAQARAAQGTFPWSAALLAAVPIFVTRFVFAGVLSATSALWLGGLVGKGLPLGAFLVPLATLTGAFIAMRAIVSLAGAQLAGQFSDLGGRRWFASALALLAGAAGLWFAASNTVPFAMAGALLASGAVGGVQAIVAAIAGDRGTPSERARMLGLAYTLGDLSSAIAPPLALALIGTLSIATIYRVCAGLLGLTVVFAFWQARGEA